MSQLIIVTGASRGFGKSICWSFVRHIRGPKHFVLTARDENSLRATSSELIESSNGSITTDCHVVDYSDITATEKSVEAMLSLSKASEFTKIYLINNAGSLGALCNVGIELMTLSALASNVTANITAPAYLTSEVVKRYQSKYFSAATELVVVNISSLAAIQPFGSKAVYCQGKAAREMFHRVLAEENKNTIGSTSVGASVEVLNYAPGPLDTDMQSEIRDAPYLDRETQGIYKKMKADSTLIQPDDSADKLLRILLTKGGFEPGAHIDYYDAHVSDPLDFKPLV